MDFAPLWHMHEWPCCLNLCGAWQPWRVGSTWWTVCTCHRQRVALGDGPAATAAAARPQQFHAIRGTPVCSGWFACRGRVPGGQLVALSKHLDDPSLSTVTAHVSVTTAASWQANTDSTVWIVLNGMQASSETLECECADSTPFCKGATDTFEFHILDIGELQTVDVGHSNDGTSPSWCPEQITVRLVKGTPPMHVHLTGSALTWPMMPRCAGSSLHRHLTLQGLHGPCRLGRRLTYVQLSPILSVHLESGNAISMGCG